MLHAVYDFSKNSYTRKRLLFALLLMKCTRFLFVGSKVITLSVLDFSLKRYKITTFFSKSKILGALFLVFVAKVHKLSNLSNKVLLKSKAVHYFVSNPKTLIQKL